MLLTILTNIFAVFGVVMFFTLIYAYIDTKRKAKKVTKHLEEMVKQFEVDK